jgi:hypothetical protein
MTRCGGRFGCCDECQQAHRTQVPRIASWLPRDANKSRIELHRLQAADATRLGMMLRIRAPESPIGEGRGGLAILGSANPLLNGMLEVHV